MVGPPVPDLYQGTGPTFNDHAPDRDQGKAILVVFGEKDVAIGLGRADMRDTFEWCVQRAAR